jgi:hypothetical protein
MAGFFDFLRRDGDSSNTVIGIILLVMLLVFVGPDVLPTLLSRTFPFLDEGIPCSRLQTANDRANHQSLIGRRTQNPLELRTIVPPLPANPTDIWAIRIVVQNNTIGTVPFFFDGQARIGIGAVPDSSGIGLIFSPNVNVQEPQPAPNTGSTTFSESNIRLLGPRQRCVHRVEIPRNSVNLSPGSSATVRSFYRINATGKITTSDAIFPDQGLARIVGGIEQSGEVPITFTASAN